jgi:hypothetical protein
MGRILFCIFEYVHQAVEWESILGIKKTPSSVPFRHHVRRCSAFLLATIWVIGLRLHVIRPPRMGDGWLV